MKIINRSAYHDYTIEQTFEAGIKLTGREVKSAKGGHVSLTGAFVRLIGSEAYLVNAQIFPYLLARIEGYDPRRTRKLLLHKKEIISLRNKLESANLTLVPIAMYADHGLVKLEVGLARGKKQYEKRAVLKERQQKRELDRQYRGKVV